MLVRGDGTIDNKEEAIVDPFTAWTGRNAEALFATRPWREFGEGPTHPPPAGACDEDKQKALPEAVIERLELLGPELPFRRGADALRLTLPPPKPRDFVPALRIRGRGLV